MHRFPIGTQYKTTGKHPILCTVMDHLTTTNSKGEIVAERYVTTHETWKDDGTGAYLWKEQHSLTWEDALKFATQWINTKK